MAIGDPRIRSNRTGSLATTAVRIDAARLARGPTEGDLRAMPGTSAADWADAVVMVPRPADGDPVSGVPKLSVLMGATLAALKSLGGSASNREIHDRVADDLALGDEIRGVLHAGGPMTVLQYRLHWARSYLKKAGAVDNSERAVWTLTEHGRSLDPAAMEPIVRGVRTGSRARGRMAYDDAPADVADGDAVETNWSENLLSTVGAIDPAAFERLCQRILRESGFTRVEVTGRSGDGGIDGIGVLRVNLVSFHVLFQCKRWRGSVGASVVRDFRGAMIGRAEKGLIMTTGSFTAEARREAARDGAPAIDLIDGESLCGLLKDLRLGVRTRLVEHVEIEPAFFAAI